MFVPCCCPVFSSVVFVPPLNEHLEKLGEKNSLFTFTLFCFVFLDNGYIKAPYDAKLSLPVISNNNMCL